jgi:hypothetical protein
MVGKCIDTVPYDLPVLGRICTVTLLPVPEYCTVPLYNGITFVLVTVHV